MLRFVLPLWRHADAPSKGRPTSELSQGVRERRHDSSERMALTRSSSWLTLAVRCRCVCLLRTSSRSLAVKDCWRRISSVIWKLAVTSTEDTRIRGGRFSILLRRTAIRQSFDYWYLAVRTLTLKTDLGRPHCTLPWTVIWILLAGTDTLPQICQRPWSWSPQGQTEV